MAYPNECKQLRKNFEPLIKLGDFQRQKRRSVVTQNSRSLHHSTYLQYILSSTQIFCSISTIGTFLSNCLIIFANFCFIVWQNVIIEFYSRVVKIDDEGHCRNTRRPCYKKPNWKQVYKLLGIISISTINFEWLYDWKAGWWGFQKRAS